jgi:hypothetical protein
MKPHGKSQGDVKGIYKFTFDNYYRTIKYLKILKEYKNYYMAEIDNYQDRRPIRFIKSKPDLINDKLTAQVLRIEHQILEGKKFRKYLLKGLNNYKIGYGQYINDLFEEELVESEPSFLDYSLR